MDERTLTALRGSIAKWEGIVAGRNVDNGADNCPLCQTFNAEEDDDAKCAGCPVKEMSGEPFCHSTPYMESVRAKTNYGTGSDEYKAAAQAELDFLKSLLPADAAPLTQDMGSKS